MASAGLDDVFVAKLDEAGGFVWGGRYGDAQGQRVRRVAVDAAGHVALAGQFTGTLDLGGTSLTGSAGDGTGDIFVAMLDDAGALVWSRSLGDAQAQDARGLAFDAAGNVLLAGEFAGTVDLGGGPLTSAGELDVLVAQLDPTGSMVWAARYGDAQRQWGTAAAAAPGRLVVTAIGKGTVDFGLGPLASPGTFSSFAAAFAP